MKDTELYDKVSELRQLRWQVSDMYREFAQRGHEMYHFGTVGPVTVNEWEQYSKLKHKADLLNTEIKQVLVNMDAQGVRFEHPDGYYFTYTFSSYPVREMRLLIFTDEDIERQKEERCKKMEWESNRDKAMEQGEQKEKGFWSWILGR